MAKFVVYEKVAESIYSAYPKKDMSDGLQTTVNLGSGLIAGFAAALVSQPADTMLSKINKTKGLPGEGTTSRLIKIAKELGFKGSYTGIGARLFMVGTLTAFQFAIYGDGTSFPIPSFPSPLPASSGVLPSGVPPNPGIAVADAGNSQEGAWSHRGGGNWQINNIMKQFVLLAVRIGSLEQTRGLMVTVVDGGYQTVRIGLTETNDALCKPPPCGLLMTTTKTTDGVSRESWRACADFWGGIDALFLCSQTLGAGSGSVLSRARMLHIEHRAFGQKRILPEGWLYNSPKIHPHRVFHSEEQACG